MSCTQYNMGVWPYVTPEMPAEEQPAIGLIGMGAMGSLYARSFSEAGWKKCAISPARTRGSQTDMPLQDIHMRSSRQVRGAQGKVRRYVARLRGAALRHSLISLPFTGVPGIHVCPDGHRVSRVADYIMYSVEAEYIDRVVSQYGLCSCVPSFIWNSS